MRSRQEIYIWIVQYQNNSCHKRTVPDNVTSLEPASRRRKTTKKKKKKTATWKKRNIKEEGSAFGTSGEIAPLSLPGKFYGQDFETQPEAGRSLVCLSLLFADDVNLLSTFNKGKKMYSISKKKNQSLVILNTPELISSKDWFQNHQNPALRARSDPRQRLEAVMSGLYFSFCKLWDAVIFSPYWL